jgi:carbonic anhydrase/acetyltransferase-like protein (isoleucine patch superfamily)
MIRSFRGATPEIDDSCFVAGAATVVGQVRLGANTSVWFGSVIRGDVARITIGKRTNVQDLSVLHVETGSDLSIGDDVTVGHRAIVHGCTVGDRVLVGMGAIIMNDAVIGEDSIIGAGAIVTEGAEIPPRSLVIGVPGKVKRELSDEEVSSILTNAEHYAERAREYVEAGFAKEL